MFEYVLVHTGTYLLVELERQSACFVSTEVAVRARSPAPVLGRA